MPSTGLEGVVVAETELSKVYGEEGRLIYRGFDIADLAEHVGFEEACYLLWKGELPDRSKLDALRGRLSDARELDSRIVDLLRAAPDDAHPMAGLRTAVSALGLYDPDAEKMERESNVRKAERITAQIPTITAAIANVREGREPIAPRDDLSHAANFLYMLRGEEPDELSAHVMDVALTLHAEHGFNASTFSSRVTIATLSDMYSAITSAIGTLKGPLHGGANQRVMAMLEEIGDPDRADEVVKRKLEQGEKVPGFGHRVYRTLDPRARILRDLAQRLGEQAGSTRWLDVADRVVDIMKSEMESRGKKIYPNVDFFSATVYNAMGIPTDLFTNIFASARIAGWTANVLEQLDDNRLIRPRADYVGRTDRQVEPIGERS